MSGAHQVTLTGWVEAWDPRSGFSQAEEEGTGAREETWESFVEAALAQGSA